MPRNRADEDRDAKVDHVLDAAETQLRSGGLAAFSVAGVARELGIAQASVYWYFPTKDHLLVAVVDRTVQQVLERKHDMDFGLADEIVWFVDQLYDFAALRAAMYERARTSAVVESFAAEFQRRLRTLLANSLRPYLPPEDLDLGVEVFAATVEGILVQCGDDAEARRRQVSFALDRLTAGRLRSSQPS